MGAQNFNFFLHHNGGFLAPNFVFWGETVPTRRKMFRQTKIKRVVVPVHPATTPVWTTNWHT